MVKIPKSPLSKEAHKHFRNKLQRGEKFSNSFEREKMVKRVEMADRGYVKDGDGITTERE